MSPTSFYTELHLVLNGVKNKSTIINTLFMMCIVHKTKKNHNKKKVESNTLKNLTMKDKSHYFISFFFISFTIEVMLM